jgi:hypothetical protein
MTSDKPTNPGNAHDLRQLLEAVLEAVTIPYNAPEYARRIEERADWVLTTVKGALAEDARNIGWNADYLRNKLAAEEAEAAERAARASVDRAFPHVARFLADEEPVVIEVEDSGADSTGWDPDDPHGHADAYERGEPR